MDLTGYLQKKTGPLTLILLRRGSCTWVFADADCDCAAPRQLRRFPAPLCVESNRLKGSIEQKNCKFTYRISIGLRSHPVFATTDSFTRRWNYSKTMRPPGALC